MLPFADVVHLFADELARLGARRLPFALVLAGSFECFSFRHDCSPSRWKIPTVSMRSSSPSNKKRADNVPRRRSTLTDSGLLCDDSDLSWRTIADDRPASTLARLVST